MNKDLSVVENEELAIVEKKNTFEHNGRTYTITHPGMRWYLQHLDRCKNQFGVILQEKYYDQLMKNCVSPKITVEDFEGFTDLMEVITKIETFLGTQL